MKKIYTLCAVLAVVVFVLNGVITQASNQDSFWNDAAQSGMAEVMLGNLALQKSSSDEIKQFAQKLVDDHTAANNELKTLAASKSATLPADVNAKQRSTYDKLSALSGDEFDREFAKVMVKDHEKAVGLFRKQSDRGDDADVKAFAARTLPALQGHLEMARSLNDRMKGMKSGDTNRNSNSSSNSGNMNSDMNMNSNSGNMNSNRSSNSNRKSNSKSNNNTNSNTNSNANRR
jgi:putative membrane protein